MEDILPHRIEPASDRNSGQQDAPDARRHAKPAATSKPASPRAPEVSAPEENEKHELDELA
jgi:hypothetical protein